MDIVAHILDNQLIVQIAHNVILLDKDLIMRIKH